MRRRCAHILLTLILVLAWPIAANTPGDPLVWRVPDGGRERAEEIVARLTPDQRVAQLLLVGWPTVEPSPEVMRWITERGLGGIKVFGWNGNDLAALTASIAEMQAAAVASGAQIPLYVATDQEGGWVRHVRGTTSITPGNMAIGATALPYDAYMSGRYIASELRALGINMNFAPTVDLYRNPEAHVIGPRAFSSDPELSGLLGTAFYRGSDELRVIATAKHFPGHGNASGDSHGMLPVIYDSWESIWETDLVPFRMLIRAGVPAVLSGHLAFPETDAGATPASISSFFKHEILRDTLGFEGVVVTDDLYMLGAIDYAVERGWSFPRLVREAVLAGNDLVMLSRTPPFDGDVWRELRDAYDTDPLFRARVDESATRNIAVKLAYLAGDEAVPLTPDPARVGEAMRTVESQSYLMDLAGRSITVVHDREFPVDPGSAGRTLLVGRDGDFFRAGGRHYPGAAQFRISKTLFYRTDNDERAALIERAAAYDTVVFSVSDPGTAGLLAALEPLGVRVVVISVLSPIYLSDAAWVSAAVAAYGWGRESFDAAFAVLRGDYEATGVLPVRMVVDE